MIIDNQFITGKHFAKSILINVDQYELRIEVVYPTLIKKSTVKSTLIQYCINAHMSQR